MQIRMCTLCAWLQDLIGRGPGATPMQIRVCTLCMHGCRNTLEGGGGSARLGKRSKQPMAQLVEVDIPGGPAERVRAPVAGDANVDPHIGRHIM